MESEGPYTIDSKGEIWWILFDGEKVQTAPKDLVCYSTLVCSLLNTAYAEGRKSAEKDFQELLELANEASYFNQDIMGWRMKYADWKKARGIE